MNGTCVNIKYVQNGRDKYLKPDLYLMILLDKTNNLIVLKKYILMNLITLHFVL